MKNIINGILSQHDKLIHFFASGWLFLMLTYFIKSQTTCFLISLGIGIAWELLWNLFKGKPIDLYDIGANFVGIFVSNIPFVEL